MSRTVKLWLHGLAAAAIGGGSSAVTGSVSVNLIDPDHFNLATHAALLKMLELIVVLFVMNGILSAMAYLKQAPLPPEPPDPPEQANAAGVGK